MATDGEKSEDDLTIKLAEMAKLNEEIKRLVAKGMGTDKLLQAWLMLQWTVALYFNADQKGMPRAV